MNYQRNSMVHQKISLNNRSILQFIFILIFLQFHNVVIQATIDTDLELSSLNDQTLIDNYHKNIANRNKFVFNNNKTVDVGEKIKFTIRKSEVQALEISGLNRLFQINSNTSIANGIIDLFFPQISLGELKSENFQLECLNLTGNGLTNNFLDIYKQSSNFKNLSVSNESYQLIFEYFSRVRLIKFTSNRFRNLESIHLDIFKGTTIQSSKLEAIFFDSNLISSVRHDTFYDLNSLKYLDFSNNRLKIIHPLTFSVFDSKLTILNLANNNLRALFYTPLFKQNYEYNNNSTNFTEISKMSSKTNTSLTNLKFLFLKGNNDLNCDCGLLWLYHFQEICHFDDFTCHKTLDIRDSYNASETYFQSEIIHFNTIKNESFLNKICKIPNIHVDTSSLDQTSSYSLFRSFSNRWFNWNVLVDKRPVTTPFPYLMSDEKRKEINSGLNEFNKYIDYLNRNDSEKIDHSLDNQKKHVFQTWRTSDVVFDCTNADPDGKDKSNSTIIWKTQHGYLSFLDKDLTDSLNSYLNEELGIDEDEQEKNNPSIIYSEKFRNSFKIFYQLNKLTKIYNNLTVKVGQKFGGQSFSNYFVNSKNQLVVTNMRQIVAGPFVCISINEQGIQTYEYDIHVRVGIDEYFIYCLFVSIMSGFIPSIISLVICCICEYKAARDYNIIRHYTCNPTPMGETPPNFDLNDWMANAASYLPNLKIHDTLDQVSKKLRKGMGKASIAVKTLGITSSAYIYSVYEHSTQRWMDIKDYVPTFNVPTLNFTVPTVKYPPVGQIANRMRMGMGNMFCQVKEFCGTSDLNHTASIGDLELDTNASNAVGGQAFIFDQFGKKQTENEVQRQTQFQNYYRFLSFLREESRKINRKKRFIPMMRSNNPIPEEGVSEIEYTEAPISPIQGYNPVVDETQPTTSAQAMQLNNYNEENGYVDEPTVVALPKLNMIITFSNINNEIQKIESLGGNNNDDEEDDDANNYIENYKNNYEFDTNNLVSTQKEDQQYKEEQSPRNSSINQIILDEIPFIDNETNV